MNFRSSRISDIMSLKRFFKILRHLHISNIENMPNIRDPSFDKLYKVRPMIYILRNSFLKAYRVIPNPCCNALGLIAPISWFKRPVLRRSYYSKHGLDIQWVHMLLVYGETGQNGQWVVCTKKDFRINVFKLSQCLEDWHSECVTLVCLLTGDLMQVRHAEFAEFWRWRPSEVWKKKPR